MRHAEIYSLKSFCPGDGVDLDKLIALARTKVAAPAQYTSVDAALKVTARSAINVRRGAPNTHADVVRVIPADQAVDVAGLTSNGEAIHGNAHWYRDATGNFFWAGATDAPIPV